MQLRQGSEAEGTAAKVGARQCVELDRYACLHGYICILEYADKLPGNPKDTCI